MRWSIAFGIIDTLAVMLRLFVRKSRTKIAADDWMIMASLVPAYSMIASASICELFSSRRAGQIRLIGRQLRDHERRCRKA